MSRVVLGTVTASGGANGSGHVNAGERPQRACGQLPQPVKIVGPPLHHDGALLEHPGSVVCATVGVFHDVIKLQIDEPVVEVQLLNRHGAGSRSESVSALFLARRDPCTT